MRFTLNTNMVIAFPYSSDYFPAPMLKMQCEKLRKCEKLMNVLEILCTSNSLKQKEMSMCFSLIEARAIRAIRAVKELSIKKFLATVMGRVGTRMKNAELTKRWCQAVINMSFLIITKKLLK